MRMDFDNVAGAGLEFPLRHLQPPDPGSSAQFGAVAPRFEPASSRLSEQALYDYLADVSGPHTRVTPGVNTTRFRNGKDLYGSYHYEKFYYPTAFRNTLRRLQMFQAPLNMEGWTVYEFGCCIGALSLECVRRGAHARAWEYNPSKVIGCQRLASFLGLSAQQVAFYQQDLIAWLKNPDARAEFQLKFPAADLTVCCAMDMYIPKNLRPILYRLLATSTTGLCWFESNSREPLNDVIQHLHRAGFSQVDHVGDCSYRHAFIARTGPPAKSESPTVLRSDKAALLTQRQQNRLRRYIHAFLSTREHQHCFEQNHEALLQSLLDPHRLSIALMPVDKHISRSDSNRTLNSWYFKFVKPYARYHKEFLNEMDQRLKAELFTAKLIHQPRERNLRDFLLHLSRRRGRKSASETRFFKGLDWEVPLDLQEVKVLDCLDYSSGRGYDEGAIVNKIVLGRKNGAVTFFLKGLGQVRRQKVGNHGRFGFALFEVTAFEAAKIVGLNSTSTKCYRDENDPTMAGYTLLEEIEGVNTNQLFDRHRNGQFRINPTYARFKDRLIREFAQIAALSDLLRKGDRKIVQPVHPEYDANCLINLKTLASQPRHRAIFTIDHHHLFQPNNHNVLHDIKHGKCIEIGIVSAFEEFYSGDAARERLLTRYGRAYLHQWKKILSRRKALAALVAHHHGKHSTEYQVFRQSIRRNPQKEFEVQKAALLRSLSEDARRVKAKRARPFRLVGQGLHGRVFKLSPDCCIKVFRNGKHAEAERKAYEAARGCRFFPAMHDAGPNYLILEHVRGESIADYLKKTGRISSRLIKQIVELQKYVRNIGFTWRDFAPRHLLLTEQQQLKVIDLKNAFELDRPNPLALLDCLRQMGFLETFLSQVEKLEPSLGGNWRRATARNPADK